MNKLTIKEAGRYSNFLKEKMNEINYLAAYGLDNKVRTTIETHKRSEAIADGVDEEIEVEGREVDVEIDIDSLNILVDDILEEKILLAIAIGKAKKTIEIVDGKEVLDLDSAIEYSKTLRGFIERYYLNFTELKPSTSKKQGVGYTFNIEGNQVSYQYPIEIETTLNIDKEYYIKRLKEAKLKADKISQSIETSMSSNIVEFVPRYSYLDSLEDMAKTIEEK